MPTPLHAHFEIPEDAESSFPMIPDDDDDAATAMASVNPEMVIEMNMPGIVLPLFVEGAAPIGLVPGENLPFAYVTWETMQSVVLSPTGAQFSVIPVEIGANQVPIPIGEGVIVSCGPFECSESPMAPPLSIANSKMCTEWDPMVEIQVGKVDNDVLDPATAADGESEANDGVDLGIVTSSSLKMEVKHVFSGVANGTNTSTTIEAAKGSDKTLAMKAVASIRVDQDEDDTDTANIDDTMVCDNTYTSEDVSSKADRPAGCFRLVGPGAGRSDNDASKGANYLSGWSIELSPLGADVAWGRVDWEENPFEDLECGAADAIMVADHVDVCGMFEDEVDLATGKGWSPEVVFNADNRVVMWAAGAKAGSGEKMFKTVWFDDNLNGKILKDATSAAQADRVTALAASGVTDPPQTSGLHDLYNQNAETGNISKIWELLTDADGDLTAGDLGKADLVSDSDDPKTADNETTIVLEACASGVDWVATDAAGIATGCEGAAAAEQAGRTKTNPDGKADNYAADLAGADDFRECSEDDGGDDDDGSICDATWTREAEVTFADGTFGCATTRMVTVTCTWDADGGMAQGRNALPNAFDGNGDGSNLSFFLKCEAE